MKDKENIWDGPLLAEQRSREELCDPERQETGNKEGREMTSTQSALNIGNQNDMINQSYNDAGTPNLTDDIERMLTKPNKDQ